MSLYLDTSALLKRYIDEPDSDRFNAIIEADTQWLTSRITWIEGCRNLARLLEPEDARTARAAFEADWQHFSVVELDAEAAREAATLAEVTLVRSLDAIHLGACRRTGDMTPFVTADLRQAQAARSLGMTVIGV